MTKRKNLCKKWAGRTFVRTTLKNTHQEELRLQQLQKILSLYFRTNSLIHVRNCPMR